jgi:hypothetical protein
MAGLETIKTKTWTASVLLMVSVGGKVKKP